MLWSRTSSPMTALPSMIAAVPIATRSPIVVFSRTSTLWPVWKSSPIVTSQ